jgi:hypothetical protein
MNKEKYRAQRLADFEGRKLGMRSNLFILPDYDWQYIPVHPMANETDWLERHNLSGVDCTRVDCYWRMKNDVVFLQVYSSKSGWHKAPGLYARWNTNAVPMLYLAAVVAEDQISQEIVERTMKRIQAINKQRDLLSDKSIEEQLKKIE